MARLLRWLPLFFLIALNASLAFPQAPKVQPGAKTQPAKKDQSAKKTQAAKKNQPAAKPKATAKQNQPAANPKPTGKDQPTAKDQPPKPIQIETVHIFQAAGTPEGEGSYLMEIAGQSFPDSPAVFLAPLQGLSATKPPEVVSKPSTTQIVVKFTATKGYFPLTVGVAGTGGAIKTYDLPKGENVHSDDPLIKDVEVLQLNRVNGTGRVKIDGANFGLDKDKISVAIVPQDPSLPAFGPGPLKKADGTPAGPYDCPVKTPEQQATPPKVLTPQDDIVIVDFAFPCTRGFSEPFRIARVLLTVTKEIKPDKATPDKTVPDKTVPDKTVQSLTASFEMLPGRDQNLTYRSTILSKEQARSRFGGGVDQNFYVVQLSIVNKGPMKIQVPLASIQAEVEWFAGSGKLKVRRKMEGVYYREGPATVAPVPLAGAVSYFSSYQKATGPRARFFNSLQGVTTIGSAIQLFFGPGFAQAVGIAGGGLRQGLAQIFQDMSPEQLANLTSQSFESLESVSGNGGSIEKVIFIQKGAEELAPGTTQTKVFRLIDNIKGFEINGYEAPETPAKALTPQQP